MIEQVGIEVLTSQMRVASRSLDSEHTALDVEERHIESSTTEIIDQDIALLVGLASAQTVGNRGGSGLVDDAKDVETSNRAGIFRGLSLVIVEVGWDGDDGFRDFLAKLHLSDLLHLPKCQPDRVVGVRYKARTLPKTIAEISCGENVLFSPRYSTSTFGLLSSSVTLNGHDSMSFLTVGSSNLRPMRRLQAD